MARYHERKRKHQMLWKIAQRLAIIHVMDRAFWPAKSPSSYASGAWTRSTGSALQRASVVLFI